MEKKLREKLKGGKFENVPASRSRTMSRIRSKGNKTTEARLRYNLVRRGISGWIMHPNYIKGNPDFFFPREQLAIFVDGCFWHGCPLCGHLPKINQKYWAEKIRRNRQRDKGTNSQLKSVGIIVLRFWEHELNEDIESCVTMVRENIVRRPYD